MEFNSGFKGLIPCFVMSSDHSSWMVYLYCTFIH